MMASTQANRSLQAPQDYNVPNMFIPDRCNETPCCPHEEYPAAYAEKTSIAGPGPLRGQPGALSLNDDTSYNSFDFLRQRQPEALTTAINRCVNGRSTAEWPGSDDSSFGSIALPCIADPNAPENGYNSMPTFSHPPMSPFHAPAALQTSLSTSQTPQAYNHRQTVPSNETNHPSPSNQPFHSAGAHPALPWQQSTASLNQTAQMAPPANSTAPPTAYCGHSSTHPPLSGRYCEQPSGVASPGKPPPTARVHNELAVHSVRPMYDDPSLSAAHGMMPGMAPGFETSASGQPRMHQGSNNGCVVGDESGCDCGMQTPVGPPPAAPWDHLSPPPTSKCVAGGGDSGLRPSISYPTDNPLQPYQHMPGQPTVSQQPHPYIHPYARPHSHGRRYGRIADAYGIPPPYAPYWRGPSYHPMAPMGRPGAAWLPPGHPPAPAPTLGPPQAGRRTDITIHSRTPDTYTPAYLPLPCPGTDPYTEYHPRAVYGRMSARLPPSSAPPLLPADRILPRSASADNARVREQLPLRARMPLLYGTDSETVNAASTYDGAPSAAAAGTATVSSCSLAQPWGSFKRPRLAAHWPLAQPATPPTAPSPPPTTPPHSQPPQPPVMAPTQLPQHTTVTTPMTAMSAPETTAPATHGAPPSPVIAPHTMRSVAPTAAAAVPANEEDTELRLSLDELYLCIQGLDAEELISVTPSKQSTVSSIGGCVSRAAVVADSGAQMAETAKASSCVTLPMLQRLSTAPLSAGSSSQTPATAPAAPSALASVDIGAAPLPAEVKAEAEPIDTVDSQDAQPLQPTVKVQTEPTATSGAVAAPPALTAANMVAGHHEVPQLGSSSASTQQQQEESSLRAQPSIAFRMKRCDGGSAGDRLLLSQQTTANKIPSGAVTVSSEVDARKTNRGGFRGPLPRRFFGNTSRQLPASSVALLQQTDRSEPLPGPVTVTVAGGKASGRSGGGGEGGEGAVVGAGGVVGVFHVLPYLEGAKCIEFGGEMVSRSAFERAGGSMMAKWYRSIKVLPDGISLGKWLASNNLPILKGNPRCSKKSSRHEEEQDAM